MIEEVKKILEENLRIGTDTGYIYGKGESAKQIIQLFEPKPDEGLTILKANPYWDAPDESAEGIYEAGKEAQLESDRAKLQAKIEEAKKQERKEIGLFIKKLGFNNYDVDRLLQGQALKTGGKDGQ